MIDGSATKDSSRSDSSFSALPARQLVDQLAAKIAADLFTNGQGRHADRLVLTDKHGHDLGGWGEGPAADRIAGLLLPALAALLDPAPPNQQESMMDDLAFLDAINNPPVGARLHWRDDWYFQRTKLGAVLLTLPDKSQKMIPPNEWASIVASVSARGETGDTFREAATFHGHPVE